jgi:hypothetical protein
VGTTESTSAIRALEQEIRYHASVPVSEWVASGGDSHARASDGKARNF